MAFNFNGKKILVTGASKGIGRGISLALAKFGCKVYALARSKDLLDDLATENANIIPVVQNLANWHETKATLGQLEVLDGIVNNAGLYIGHKPALEKSKDELDTIMNLHTLAPINCIQVIGQKMVAAGKKGSIVNVSSLAGLGASPGLLGYCVSKAALDMATKQFALELGPFGIRVNSVNPTFVLTDLANELPAAEVEAIIERIADVTPMQRIAELEEVTNPVLYLLSECAAMVTGTTHVIDGGWTCNLTTKQ